MDWRIAMVSSIEPLCIGTYVYVPPLPTNNTGVCIALHTPRTLPLLTCKSPHLASSFWRRNVGEIYAYTCSVACCPTNNSVYAVTTNATTDGTVNCEYIACDLAGYEEFRAAAACMGRSLIVENNDDEDLGAAEADSKRACEFNRRGSEMPPGQTNSGGMEHGQKTSLLLLSMFLGAALFWWWGRRGMGVLIMKTSEK